MFKFLSLSKDKTVISKGLHYEATISKNLFYKGSSTYVIKAYYSFPRKYRNNKISVASRVDGDNTIKTYGSRKQFLTLYRLLCDRFFGGASFLDVFFKPEHLEQTINYKIYVQPLLTKITGQVQEARDRMQTEKEDYRFKFWKSIKSYFNAPDKGLNMELEEAAKSIKTLIVRQLATGKIPINFKLSTKTLKRRRDLGIEGSHPFYATGQLINSIIIELRLEEV